MRGRVIVGVLVCTAVLAGCGGDDDDSAAPAPPSATTTASAPAPTSAAPGGPELAALGLTIDELPEGFAVDPAPPGRDALPQCVREGLAVIDRTARESHELNFFYSRQGPYISETLGRFADPAKSVAAQVTAFRACPSMQAVADPQLGDESHQFRLEQAGAAYDIAVLRVGDVAATFVYSGEAGFDDTEQAVVYRLAVDKLGQAG